MLADVKTAFLYGDARRSLYVELPPEDPLSASGKLELYGTRDAPISFDWDNDSCRPVPDRAQLLTRVLRVLSIVCAEPGACS